VKIVVHAPEPKPAGKIEPVVGGVYYSHGDINNLRLVVLIDGTLRSINLSSPNVKGEAMHTTESQIREYVQNGKYVLVDAELHVKEGA
jgi:hypothetical protein